MSAADERIGRVERLILALIERGMQMSAQLEALQAEVARNASVIDSAMLLIDSLADQIAAVKNDPAALQELADNLKASSDKLAGAVAENTPAAPEPEPGPGPT
jgi:ABC-type transporter Mla subunit MlaD